MATADLIVTRLIKKHTAIRAMAAVLIHISMLGFTARRHQEEHRAASLAKLVELVYSCLIKCGP